MNLREQILETIKRQGRVKTAEIVEKTNYSRAYVQRHLKNLAEDGIIALMGKANQAHYILAAQKNLRSLMPLRIHKIMKNQGIAEDDALRGIKEQSSIFRRINGNVASIIDYAFTEMLNNAIEHSLSEKIDVFIVKTSRDIRFTVTDWGIGIFNNIMKKKSLLSTMEAIQDLLKGKETTLPEAHSGEGIFFTSKIADFFTIRSFGKKIAFDNAVQDIYVKDIKSVGGTRVDFTIGLSSKKELSDIFSQYTDDSLEFSKTAVKVKLYRQNVDYVSRSQARRILTGLEKFKTIELDFQDVKTIGQAFADEIFRVWRSGRKNVQFVVKNTNENIDLMIRRAEAPPAGCRQLIF